MLKQRVQSSILIIALAVMLFLMPAQYAVYAMALISLMMFSEYLFMQPQKMLLGVAVCCFTTYLAYAFLEQMIVLMYVGVFARMLCMVYDIKAPKLFMYAGILDVAVFANCSIRLFLANPLLFFGAIAVVAGIDVSGYVGGRMFGKRRLFPNISPNKTFEGYLCALFWVICVFAMCVIWQELSISLLTLHLLMVYILAVVGDLNVSYLKRHVGIKDTGNILPGHGGLLDRADGWLAVIPWVYLFTSI